MAKQNGNIGVMMSGPGVQEIATALDAIVAILKVPRGDDVTKAALDAIVAILKVPRGDDVTKAALEAFADVFPTLTSEYVFAAAKWPHATKPGKVRQSGMPTRPKAVVLPRWPTQRCPLCGCRRVGRCPVGVERHAGALQIVPRPSPEARLRDSRINPARGNRRHGCRNQSSSDLSQAIA